jgi:photosystem II stability/assembly factor-like uncharacterized protein
MCIRGHLKLKPPSQLIALFLFSLLSFGSLRCKAQTIKLISPGTGWMTVLGPKLLWTNDNGAHWTDITPTQPAAPRGATLMNVFFRDQSEGWAIVSYPASVPTPITEANRERGPEEDTPYILMHTRNSGGSWDATPVAYRLPHGLSEDDLAGPIELYFLDSMHGWIEFDISGMSRPGKLLATKDGGRTWKWMEGNRAFFSGPISFTSVRDGWLASYWDDSLNVTHDGAKSWQKVALMPPADLPEPKYPRGFGLPIFKDSRNGYVAVEYAAREGTPWKVMIYATYSGGRSWQPLKRLSIPDDALFALTDSTVIFPTNTVIGKPSTESVSLTNQEQPAKPVTSRNISGIEMFSFVDVRNGWAQTRCGLFATANGGATWKNISPPPTNKPPTQIITFRQTPSGQVVTKGPPPPSPCAS